MNSGFLNNGRILFIFLPLLTFGCSDQGNGISPTASLFVSPPIGDTLTAFYLSGEDSRSRDDIPFGLTYYWTLDDTVQLPADPTQSRTSIRIRSFGPHQLKLTVRNVWGEEDTSAVNVMVQEYKKVFIYQDPRDGQLYKTVRIGNYWWFAENLRYGSVLELGQQPTKNGIVEKYVRDPQSVNQEGFYTPQEAHLYSLDQDSSICPPGWFLPFYDCVISLWSISLRYDIAHQTEFYSSGFLSHLSLRAGGGYYNLDSTRFEPSVLSYWLAAEIKTNGSKPGYNLMYFGGSSPFLASNAYEDGMSYVYYPTTHFAVPVRCVKKN